MIVSVLHCFDTVDWVMGIASNL